MSIWCSWQHIGTDPTVIYEITDGLYEVDLNGGTEGRAPVPQHPEGGNVLGYAEGFGNHYPDLTGTHERPAAIALAHLPHWCVPGVEEGDHEYEVVGQWLRIEVAVPESLSFWTKADDGGPTVTSEGATVVIDRTAAETLRDQLTDWLNRATVEPIATEPDPGLAVPARVEPNEEKAG